MVVHGLLPEVNTYSVSLGGLVVIVLDNVSKGRGFKPEGDDRFLRAIKIHSTTSFGGEYKIILSLTVFHSQTIRVLRV
jgi:hypothetical protein